VQTYKTRKTILKLQNYKVPYDNEDQDTIDIYKKWEHQLTGRIIFCKGVNFGYENSLDFFCGPEDDRDCISDLFDCYLILNEIFKDIPNIEIGAAENYHEVFDIIGPIDDMWNKIKTILENEGAIYREDLES